MFTRAHVSMITYRVDVYRSRPIGASLLCLALKGLPVKAIRERTRENWIVIAVNQQAQDEESQKENDKTVVMTDIKSSDLPLVTTTMLAIKKDRQAMRSEC